MIQTNVPVRGEHNRGVAPSEPTAKAILGADGCRHGAWVAVVETAPEGPTLRQMPTTAALFSEIRRLRPAVAVLDIPIGLPALELRRCDLEARRLLGRAASSVFLTPPREVLRAHSQAEASSIWRRLTGRGCPAQTFGILPRIREVDQELRTAPRQEVLEGHPELALRELARGAALPSKHTAAGRAARVTLLGGLLPRLSEWLARRPGLAEDILDACACWLVARRVVDGSALRVPSGPLPRDRAGLPMAIWY